MSILPPNAMSILPRRMGGQVVLLAVFYCLLMYVLLTVGRAAGVSSVVWPTNALALGIYMLFRRSDFLPFTFAVIGGAFLVHLVLGDALSYSVACAVGSGLTFGLVGWGCTHFGMASARTLSVRMVIGLAGVAIFATIPGALVGAATLAGDGVIWGYEATRSLAAPDPRRTILHVRLPRDPDAPVLLRADRVDFPPDAVTPRHGHAGPGIRRLLAGRLFAEIGDTHRRIDAGEAWFESGLEPVVGRNIAPASAFVRCMVLDPDLLGRPTFRPSSAEDAAKPRAVGYRQFFDTIVTLQH